MPITQVVRPPKEALAPPLAKPTTSLGAITEVALSTGQSGYVAGSSSALILRKGDRS